MEVKIQLCDICEIRIDNADRFVIKLESSYWWTGGGTFKNRAASNSVYLSSLIVCRTCCEEFDIILNGIKGWKEKRAGTRRPNIVVTDRGVRFEGTDAPPSNQPKQLK